MIRLIKKYFQKIKDFVKKRYSYKPNIIHDILVLIITVLSMLYIWVLIVFSVILFIVVAFHWFKNRQFIINHTDGSGIIFGSRGVGKGILLNYLIRKNKNIPFSNVPYGKAEVLDDISEFMYSLKDISVDDFINDTITYIDKIEKFEGRDIIVDDVGVYYPNWLDNLLKKKYPSLPILLAIMRHLYNSRMVITTQDYERPYKIMKELQSDFAIKGIKTVGWGFLWNSIPILRYFVYTKYIYYENKNSINKLPFNAKAIVNETLKHGYLTSGQATKEVYEAENGKIRWGSVLQFKKYIEYDTRYFHQKVYGYKAPSS